MGGTEDNEEAVEVAKEFLAGVASRFSDRFEVTPHEMTDDDVVEIAVTGDDLGLLIGPRGQTLTALQELTRTVVQRRVPLSRTRLMVDVAGYREARREALARFTHQVADRVKASGEPQELEPMSAADRKVVHDTANGIDGVATRSEGEDADRHVVILPA
jgi:spoIIIJ-associated protein